MHECAFDMKINYTAHPRNYMTCKKCLNELGICTQFHLYIKYHKDMFKISGSIYRNILTLFGKSHPLLLVSYVLKTDLLSLDFDN